MAGWSDLTPFARALILGVPVLGVVSAALWYKDHGPAGTASFVPTLATAGAFKETASTSGSSSATLPLPSADVSDKVNTALQIRMQVMAWNAQMGLLLANGGADTTKGSLMEGKGINLNITRSDKDGYGSMETGLTECATELSRGAQDCSAGLHYAIIMGDGGAAVFTGMNDTLAKLDGGKGAYTLEAIGAVGRSDGEDAFMGPPECQSNPSACKGLLISGSIMDGDWNLQLAWDKLNGICNNPDLTTYDPSCVNWLGTDDFNAADDAFINGTCETRPVVSGGHKTGKTQKVCVGGVVTWTPGDVTVATKKGGVVKLISTRQNTGQMPATIIGIKAWNAAHVQTVEDMLDAALTGGDQLKTNPRALAAAGKASVSVYGGEEDGAYWTKYYTGVTETDLTGLQVALGGSRAWNVADAGAFFGLTPGNKNGFLVTYDAFGAYDVANYPDKMPTFIPAAKIWNGTYLKAVVAKNTAAPAATAVKAADVQDFSSAPTTDVQIGKRAWAITFVTGSADITPDSQATLRELEQALVVSKGTRVEVHGHTDNVGNPATNFDLSKKRADAVAAWLAKDAPSTFPADRTTTFGHGDEQPVASNSTPAGQAQNRRVEIILKAL